MDVSPVLIWFLLGIAFFVIELVLPGFVLFFLGIGAWCVAAVLAMLDVPLTAQLLIFIFCASLSLILLRAKFRSIFVGESKAASKHSSSATVVVTDAIIPPAEGRIKYSGSFWRAIADEPLDKGETALIVEQDNLIIKVRKIQTDKEK